MSGNATRLLISTCLLFLYQVGFAHHIPGDETTYLCAGTYSIDDPAVPIFNPQSILGDNESGCSSLANKLQACGVSSGDDAITVDDNIPNAVPSRHGTCAIAILLKSGVACTDRSPNGRCNDCQSGNVVNGKCVEQPQNCANPTAGNPIEILTGNKLMQVSDYRGVGENALSWTRVYDHQNGGWQFPYTAYLEFPDQQLLSAESFVLVRLKSVLYLDDGTKIEYAQGSGGNYYTYSNRALDRPGTYQITYPDGTSDTFGHMIAGYQNATVTAYKLVRRISPTGHVMTIAYDDLDRMASVTNSSGRSLSLAYDVNDRLVQVTDPAGNSINYTYTAAGLLEFVIYPDNNSDPLDNPRIQYLYDGDRLTGVIDELGHAYATYAYVGNRAVSTEHAGGVGKTSITYDHLTSTATVTNALGKTSRYKYGGFGIEQVEGDATDLCDASVRSQAYDANGYVDESIDENGVVTDYQYDDRGRMIEKTVGVGTEEAVTTSITWAGRYRTSVTTPGQKIEYAYSGQNLISRKITDLQDQTLPYSTNGNVRLTEYSYNSLGFIETIDGPRTDVNDVTSYEYDEVGNVTKIINPLGHETIFLSRDARGLPLSIEDANGVVSEMEYDPRGNLLSVAVKHVSGDSKTEFTYNAANLLVKVILPNGSELNYEYDDAQRLIAISNNLSERMEYTLDAADNVVGEIAKAANGTITRSLTRVYDEMNRLRNTLGSNGQNNILDYDLKESVVATDDALGRQSSMEIDALDRVVSSINPYGHSAAFSYDARNNLVRVSDLGGVETAYTYDGLDNLIQEASIDAGTMVYHYDAAGNMITSTDARGVVVNYTYDALGRLLSRQYPGSATENVAFSYDAGPYGIGRLASVVDESGITTYTYDHRGNLLEETRDTPQGIILSTSYTYDLANNINSITYPSGRVISYVRDEVGRIHGITDQMPSEDARVVVSDVAYAPFGPAINWVSGNGVTNAYSLDLDYRVHSITVSGENNLGMLSYVHNSVDNIVAIDDLANVDRSQNFDYDLIDRLTQADGAYGNQTYTYDANGNRLQRQRTFDDENGESITRRQNLTYVAGSNRLDKKGNKAVLHDAAGNRISEGDGKKTATYNHANRKSSFTKDGVLQATYRYNAFGQRTLKVRHKTEADVSKHFYYGQDGTLLGNYTLNPNGSVHYFEYIWMNATPIVRIRTGYKANGNRKADKVTWLHVDHLNSPRIGSDDDQRIVWRWDSDPFGREGIDSDPDGDGVKHSIPLRFPGQYRDGEAGLNYNYFRTYDPSIGRYTQSDPIGLSGGLNTYAYVGGNPLNSVDPDGLRGRRAPGRTNHITVYPCLGCVSTTMQSPGNPYRALPWQDPNRLNQHPAYVGDDGVLRTGDQTAYSCPIDSGDSCKGLIDEMLRLVYAQRTKPRSGYDGIASRYNTQRNDPGDLYRNNRKSWDTHNDQIRRQQRTLRRLIERARKLGCHVPAEIITWAYINPPAVPGYIARLPR